jgi:hypothetical protein
LLPETGGGLGEWLDRDAELKRQQTMIFNRRSEPASANGSTSGRAARRSFAFK